MDYPSFTIQSRALYAVDLMLEWRNGKGEWAGVWLSMGCHMCAVRESTHASMLLPKDLQCVVSLSLCALSLLATQMVAGGWSLSCWR